MNISELVPSRKPITLSVIITGRCNFACPWCYAAKQRPHTELDVDWTDDTMRTFKQLLTRDDLNIDFVVITGGEPLLDWPRVKEVIEAVRERDARCEKNTGLLIHTNGSLLTEEIVDSCNRHRVSVNVSVNSHGIKGIAHLVESSTVGHMVIPLINKIESLTIRSVPLRGEAYAENIYILRSLFPSAFNISIAPDQTEFCNWTEKDVENEVEQIRHLRVIDPEFYKWASHLNTLRNEQEPSVFVRFHGTGDVIYRDGPDEAVEETNDFFGMPPKLSQKLTEALTPLFIPTLSAPVLGEPYHIELLTNLNCNLACTYCYEHKGRGANDAATMKRFIEARYDALGIRDTAREVILDCIGGESLLYPELLDEICAYTTNLHKKRNCTGEIIISIPTNGTLIAEDKKVQDFLLKWRPWLGFSIDGTKAIHDDCRIDRDGNPTYDRAVAGWNWAKEHLCPKRIGVKATYCHKTIDRWAQGVINLIELGFADIAANVVFEEEWTLDEALPIARQMCAVVDYLFLHQLEDKVNIFQINNKELDMRHYVAKSGAKEQNHCGTCTHMLCLGFDGKLYGCNRFCTMPNPIPIGHMDGDKIVIDRDDFCQEVAEQYELWPEECKQCPYGRQCPSCSAIPYEQDGPKAFFARKPQCGFTHAMVAARLYFKMKLLERDAENNKKEQN